MFLEILPEGIWNYWVIHPKELKKNAILEGTNLTKLEDRVCSFLGSKLIK